MRIRLRRNLGSQTLHFQIVWKNSQEVRNAALRTTSEQHSKTVRSRASTVERPVAVLDELGTERAHFIGNSWGGRLGFGIGEHAPECVLSLVIGGQQPYAIDPDDPLAHAATETLAESRAEGSM
jgi:pimeloyl-ACP methyl ester carboxylesterase